MPDATDRRILQALAEDGRLPLKRIAARAGLSSPSTAERLRRLEDRGVIRGYAAELDPKALGFALQAIVRIRPLPGQLRAVQASIEALPEIVECDRVTGDDCFVARLVVRSIEQLDGILDGITDKAETSTSIVKSQPVRRRPPPLGG
jgi:Lrp/AsnC family leucine-responsive transcriptional regulator